MFPFKEAFIIGILPPKYRRYLSHCPRWREPPNRIHYSFLTFRFTYVWIIRMKKYLLTYIFLSSMSREAILIYIFLIMLSIKTLFILLNSWTCLRVSWFSVVFFLSTIKNIALKYCLRVPWFSVMFFCFHN